MPKKEFAELLNISQSQLSNWLKEGMPGPPDVDGADAWIMKSKHQRARAKDRKPMVPARGHIPSVEGEDWQSRVARAKQTEMETHKSYLNALALGDALKLEKLLSCHSRSVQAVGEAEEIARRVQKDSGEIATRSDFRAIMATVLTPIRQALDGLPTNEASRCNPAMPDVARRALEEWRDALLIRITGLAVKV